MLFRLTVLLFPVIAGVAPSAGAQDVPATSSTIVTNMEQSSGGESAQVISVRNYSSHAITGSRH